MARLSPKSRGCAKVSGDGNPSPACRGCPPGETFAHPSYPLRACPRDDGRGNPSPASCDIATSATVIHGGPVRSGRQSGQAAPCYNSVLGEVAERLKAPVSKTGMGAISSWVRIPPSPPTARGRQARRPTKARRTCDAPPSRRSRVSERCQSGRMGATGNRVSC